MGSLKKCQPIWSSRLPALANKYNIYCRLWIIDFKPIEKLNTSILDGVHWTELYLSKRLGCF